jgi:hypothetical protein
MAGILDKKKRFIDLVVTQEGKRQIASGKLKVEYASATDMHSYYDKSEKYEDVTKNIYFEVMERPENSIVLETDDSGKLVQFDISPTGSIVGDKIFEKENIDSGNIHKLKIATGSQFASLNNSLSNVFINNFKKNYFVSSKESVNFENKFSLSKNNKKFTISNLYPFGNSCKKQIVNVNDAEPFFLDKKLSHLPNFNFLPPVNEDGTSYGEYEDFRSTKYQNWESIVKELGNLAFADTTPHESLNAIGFDAKSKIYQSQTGEFEYRGNKTDRSFKKEYEIFDFKDTSENNNLLIQIYENYQNSFKKLDIIDGGTFYVPNDANKNIEKRIFYVGKIYFDSFNTPTFVNLFTIIFE